MITRTVVLTWSARIVFAFIAVLLYLTMMPAISVGLTHLGGIEGEPLIGFLGLADSALLISRGTDTLLVISTSYTVPTGFAYSFLDETLGVIIAVMVCIGLLRAVGIEKDIKSRMYLMATISIVGIFVFIITSRLLDLFV